MLGAVTQESETVHIGTVSFTVSGNNADGLRSSFATGSAH
jgi:hypothetical protein